MVDFKDANAAQRGEAIGAGIVARAQDDDLVRPVAKGGDEPVIDQACPRDARCAGTWPAPIDEPGQRGAEHWNARRTYDTPQHRRKETARERVREEAATGRARGLQGSEQGHEFRSAARLMRVQVVIPIKTK